MDFHRFQIFADRSRSTRSTAVTVDAFSNFSTGCRCHLNGEFNWPSNYADRRVHTTKQRSREKFRRSCRRRLDPRLYALTLLTFESISKVQFSDFTVISTSVSSWLIKQLNSPFRNECITNLGAPRPYFGAHVRT